MPRKTLSILFALALVSGVAVTAQNAAAQDVTAPAQAPSETLSDEARAALRAEIRAYLLDNPEVIFEAVAEYERRTAAAQADMDVTLVEINADELFQDDISWVGGNPEGDLTLVEFMDYRCSFCRRAFEPMMEFVEGDGNVRLVIKELPILGRESEIMSRFAVAAHQLGGDEAYFAAHEALYAWQGDLTDSGLQALAVTLGLDGEAVLDRMDDEAVTLVLQRNRALAQRLQISGTPSFVLGDGLSGEMLRGMVPAAQLELLAAELRG